MIDFIKRKNTIEIDEMDVFIANNHVIWNGITIYQNSLVVIYDGNIYVNETPLSFFSILSGLYGDQLTKMNYGNSFILEHPQSCKFKRRGHEDNIIIESGSISRWNKDHFCYSGPPRRKYLDEIPTFKYNGVEYSSWGYKIYIDSKEIEDGFYIKDNRYFEMIGGDLEDLEVKS